VSTKAGLVEGGYEADVDTMLTPPGAQCCAAKLGFTGVKNLRVETMTRKYRALVNLITK